MKMTDIIDFLNEKRKEHKHTLFYILYGITHVSMMHPLASSSVDPVSGLNYINLHGVL